MILFCNIIFYLYICRVKLLEPKIMRYKIGDKVRIKSLDWYNENKNVFGKVWCNEGTIPFYSWMKQHCGKVMTISWVCADCYTMVEDLENYYCDEMIECKVEE